VPAPTSTPNGFARQIAAWFEATEVASLVLPSGWFGDRPYENQHNLTYVAQRPRKLIVELDDQLLLTFTGLTSAVQNADGQLVLSGFTQCVFDWEEYGAPNPHVEVFHAGEVRFAPPVGG
jgi:hypothetical protein